MCPNVSVTRSVGTGRKRDLLVDVVVGGHFFGGVALAAFSPERADCGVHVCVSVESPLYHRTRQDTAESRDLYGCESERTD